MNKNIRWLRCGPCSHCKAMFMRTGLHDRTNYDRGRTRAATPAQWAARVSEFNPGLVIEVEPRLVPGLMG
jgi:hypothetical protein